MDATAKLHEQADRIDLWAALQSEHGFSPISIDMRSEVDRIDGYIRELRDEINWLHAELHGAEMEADYMRKGSKARQAYLMGVEDGLEEGEAVGFMNGTDEISKLEAKINTLQSCLSDAAENDRLTTHEFNQLKEERDKLRELVRDMWASVREDEDNGDAPYIEPFEHRMRELGVEV